MLALRRDRGYVYFPDAIVACLEGAGASRWTDLVAECYKTSDRELIAEEESISVKSANLFGRIEWREGDRTRRFDLRETNRVNETRYDLVERPFRSAFHRWAVECKGLFHQREVRPGWRMLLQRISMLNADSESEQNENICLEFMTKDRFGKFSIWQGKHKRGEVVAAGRHFDER